MSSRTKRSNKTNKQTNKPKAWIRGLSRSISSLNGDSTSSTTPSASLSSTSKPNSAWTPTIAKTRTAIKKKKSFRAAIPAWIPFLGEKEREREDSGEGTKRSGFAELGKFPAMMSLVTRGRIWSVDKWPRSFMGGDRGRLKTNRTRLGRFFGFGKTNNKRHRFGFSRSDFGSGNG